MIEHFITVARRLVRADPDLARDLRFACVKAGARDDPQDFRAWRLWHLAIAISDELQNEHVPTLDDTA